MSDDAEDGPSHADMLSVRISRALRDNPKQKRASNHRGSKRLQQSLTSDVIKRDRAGKPDKRSKKSRNHWLSDLSRDEKIFKFINVSLRSKCPVALSVKGADTVVKARHARDAYRSGTLPTGSYPTVGLPHWDHASERLKMIGWGLAMYEKHGKTLDLKLSDKVVNDALGSPKGFTRHMQDRIRKKLVREFRALGRPVPDFWFAVEGGVVDEIHLHGAIEGGQGQDAIDAIKRALTSAGGEGVNRQLTMQSLTRPVKWVGYVTKWYTVARFHIRPSDVLTLEDVPVFAATNGCRSGAREAYLEARKTGRILFP